MEKKFIGYEVPYDIWGGDIKAGELYIKVPNTDGKNYGVSTKLGKDFFYLPAEMVVLWKAVYEDEFVDGDIVVFEIDKASYSERTELWDRNMILEVDNVSESSLIFGINQFKFHPIYDELSKHQQSISNDKGCFRIATKNEASERTQLKYKKGDFLVCTKVVHTSMEDFTVGKVYECSTSRHVYNNSGQSHGISEDYAYDHFRYASEHEIERAKFHIAYFGEVEFKIKKGSNEAITSHGLIFKKEIEDAIQYIENPPTLHGYKLNIHGATVSDIGEICTLYELDNASISLGFGCQKGLFKELKDILKLMNE